MYDTWCAFLLISIRYIFLGSPKRNFSSRLIAFNNIYILVDNFLVQSAGLKTSKSLTEDTYSGCLKFVVLASASPITSSVVYLANSLLQSENKSGFSFLSEGHVLLSRTLEAQKRLSRDPSKSAGIAAWLVVHEFHWNQNSVLIFAGM